MLNVAASCLGCQNKAMNERLLTLLLLTGLIAGPAVAQEPTNEAPRVVNVTTDSEPGWLPSVELERQALEAVKRFFEAMDQGNDQRAYEMMSEGNRALISSTDFAAQNTQFRDQAGSLRERRILKITWTKDPARAPQPGVYAAIDIATRYANVDRQCGYVILYQSPSGGAFAIARTESNYIDNATAAEIERTRSRARLDEMWAALSRNCPNYQPAAQ